MCLGGERGGGVSFNSTVKINFVVNPLINTLRLSAELNYVNKIQMLFLWDSSFASSLLTTY